MMNRHLTRTTTSFSSSNPEAEFFTIGNPECCQPPYLPLECYKTHSLELCKRLANLGGCESELQYFINHDMLSNFIITCRPYTNRHMR